MYYSSLFFFLLNTSCNETVFYQQFWTFLTFFLLGPSVPTSKLLFASFWIRGSDLAIWTYKRPQAGFDPLAQSDTSYEADALPPSHQGWILELSYLPTNHKGGDWTAILCHAAFAPPIKVFHTQGTFYKKFTKIYIS